MNIQNYHRTTPTITPDERRKLEREAITRRDVAARVDAAIGIHGITPVLQALEEFVAAHVDHLRSRDANFDAAMWAELNKHLLAAYRFANERLAD